MLLSSNERVDVATTWLENLMFTSKKALDWQKVANIFCHLLVLQIEV